MDSSIASFEQLDFDEPIIVRSSRRYGPMTLIERGANNEHIVLVNARDRLWSRLAFQFSHEYCHVFSRHYLVPLGHRFRWFEESLCEAASLFSLRKMSVIWAIDPPYPAWRAYSGSLREYSDERINATQQFVDVVDFREWLSDNIAEMTNNSINRKLNNIIAVRLLSYFEENPSAWKCVTRISTAPDLEGNLASYLRSWEDELQDSATPSSIANLLGVSI